jgi:NAD(P)H-flavin reductase
MENIYELKPAEVIKIVKENSTTNTLVLRLPKQKSFKFLAGQFMMIGLPGFGECPISISSDPKDASKNFSLTIRVVGELTRKLNRLTAGDTVLVRGPFGNGFPAVDRNLILIGGGCGFVPLHAVWCENRKRKDIETQIFIGCQNDDSLVFTTELKTAKTKNNLHVIFDQKKAAGWSGKKGFVADLLKSAKLIENAMVFVCGPEVMYKSTVLELLKKGIEPKNIYLSLEKRMHCGAGVCQHCAVGTKYVCKDGPVFSYEFLKSLPQYQY